VFLSIEKWLSRGLGETEPALFYVE
jgi:hypothetical protein